MNPRARSSLHPLSSPSPIQGLIGASSGRRSPWISPPGCLAPATTFHALEEERKKIQMFQRELPLCLQLVTHAIETVRKQMDGVNAVAEAARDDVPILEEFIPLKPSSYSSSSDEDRSSVDGDGERGKTAAVATRKPDRPRSVQLWSQDAADSAAETVAAPTKPVAVNAKRMAGAFHPYEREKRVAVPAASTAAASSSTRGGGAGDAAACCGGEEKEKEKEGQSQLAHRKVRRNWSPELHRRFMEALEPLGGPYAATPKHIREAMKVDGLTNDEVKSHLQKYRLHSRRPCTDSTSSAQTNNISSSSTPILQFVVVGGIWVPPPTAAGPPVECPPPLADGGAVFAPLTSILPSELRPYQQQAETKQQQPKSSGDADDDASKPTASSSSFSHTTDAPLIYIN